MFDQYDTGRFHTFTTRAISGVVNSTRGSITAALRSTREMRLPEVSTLHPSCSVSSASNQACLAISPDLKYMLTCPSPLLPSIWKVSDVKFALRSLRGHKSPVTAASFSDSGMRTFSFPINVHILLRLCRK